MGQKDEHKLLGRVRKLLLLDKVPRPFRKIIVGIVGGIFLVAGAVMIVTPGPAFVFIPLGLLLLAGEFKWAERWAQKGADIYHKGQQKWRAWRLRRAAQVKR